MTIHEHPPGTGRPDERQAFLIDGCPRCAEYLADLGLHFDPERWRAFWAKMIDEEFSGGDAHGYGSSLDRQLGRQFYYLALGLQRAFGLNTDALRFPDAFRPALVVSTPEDDPA